MCIVYAEFYLVLTALRRHWTKFNCLTILKSLGFSDTSDGITKKGRDCFVTTEKQIKLEYLEQFFFFLYIMVKLFFSLYYGKTI